MAKKAKTPTKHKFDFSRTGDTGIPEVEGLSFCWVHLAASARKGWGVWTPVTKDSDLGAKAAEYFKANHTASRFMQGQEDSDYFFNGPDAVLAFAPMETIEALREYKQEMADDALRSVMDKHGSKGKLRYVSRVVDPEA